MFGDKAKPTRMSCCLNSTLLINHFMEKKSSLNGWLKRRFSPNQTPAKLSEKEIIQLEESKYIKKIGCSIPKYSIDENFQGDYFSTNTESRQTDKDIIRLPNALSVNAPPAKAKNHRISKSSLNNEEWEIFFVLDDDKKSNQPDKKGAKMKGDEEAEKNGLLKNDDEKSVADHLDDLEWDDFTADDTTLSYGEEDQLIFERTK